MLNLREPYSPFSTTTFEAFALRGTLKANYIFYYPTKITLRDKGMPRYPTPHMPTKHTKKPETKYPWQPYYRILLNKSLVLSFPRTPLTLPHFFS